MDQRKMNFDYFQMQKWMLQAARAGKLDEQNWVICLVSMFPSWIMVLKLSKNVHFLQFCADISKKPKSVKATDIYAPGICYDAFSENDMVYRGLSHRLWDISD